MKKREKISFTERLSNVKEKFKSWDEKTLSLYKNGLFFIIVVDMIGVYYLLGLKSLGIAIMVISLMFLGLLLYLERELPTDKLIKRRKKPKMETKEEEKYLDLGMNEEKPVEKEDTGTSFDMGLPNADEYQKRMENAMGTI